ncbi:hypothetical protein BDP27DRAFT_1444449, partial [Rhodocollybia butyracea]
MRSFLLFTIIASSWPAVCPLQMDTPAAGMSNRLPPADMGVIVTFIDGKTGEDLGSETIAEPQGLAPPLKAALRLSRDKGITFKGVYRPPNKKARNWLYIRVAGAPGCTEDPCFGWMAKGVSTSSQIRFSPLSLYALLDRYTASKEKPKQAAKLDTRFALWYVGISSGWPAQNGFDRRKRGKPVLTNGDNRILEKMRAEWDRIFDEFNRFFMVPEVTFDLPIPQTEPPSSNPPEAEEIKKDLNEALHRRPGDSIINSPQGRYTEVHELDSRWVYFLLIGGDKRCETASPCFGCVLLESGTRLVLVAQRKPGPVATNEVQLDRVGVYPGSQEKDLFARLARMEMQLQHHFRKLMDTHARVSNQPPPVSMPVLTFIDGKTGEDYENDLNQGKITGFAISLREAFGCKGKDITYKNVPRPRNEKRQWFYFKVVGVQGCNDDDPCFGWIATGLNPQVEGEVLWYVGFISSQLSQATFITIGADLFQGYAEWDKIFTEFKEYFMIPEVTFAIPQTNPPSSGSSLPIENPKEELNGALHRGLEDPIIFKRQYVGYTTTTTTTRHAPVGLNEQWVFFKLIGWDKRCPTWRPCFGCIAIESGTQHVLIAQRKPARVSQ